VNITKTMRIGCNPFYPIPEHIGADRQATWFIGRMAELGCGSAQTIGIRNDPELLKRIKALCQEKDVELDCAAQGVWGLSGPSAEDSRAQLLESISIAQQAGSNIIRTGYGRLNVATSRFSKSPSSVEQMARFVENLRIAAKIVEDHGVFLAIENHCDFSGREWAEIFDAVGSPNVGAALDTANGYTVFCDPNDDVQALAPYTITTHLKDMRVVDARELPFIQSSGPLIPMLPVGCALGEGNVDIPLAIETLAAKSPHAEGLHLIIEIGWEPVPEGKTQEENRLDLFHKSITYLKSIL